MLKKKILTILCFSSIISAGIPDMHPMVKSAIFPGWGESAKNSVVRARIFRLTEAMLWIGYVGVNTFSNHAETQYQSFAAIHAGIDHQGKDHSYWVDIGNYPDINTYNDEHLRFRETENLYALNGKWNWNWDSDENRNEFETLRINSDLLALTGKFVIGGIVMNHIVSAIDALYLNRLEKIESISFMPVISMDGYYNMRLQLDFNF